MIFYNGDLLAVVFRPYIIHINSDLSADSKLIFINEYKRYFK